MKRKLTRRQLASVVMAVPALAQNSPPEDDLKAALKGRQEDSQELAKREVLMSTEPAFTFKP